FFQAGAVKPARENQFGGAFASPLWHGATLSIDVVKQKIRGSVNGNVLVPRADERTPLATDPALRNVVQRFLDAYPADLPNRTDISERALNLNAPQHVDTTNVTLRVDQQLGQRDYIGARHALTIQRVDAFQFVAGQNPDADTQSHASQMTWDRQWSTSTVSSVSFGLDRSHTLLTAEPNAVGPSVSFGSVIQSLGPGSTIPIYRVQNVFRYAAQLNHTRAEHTWTVGLEMGRRQFTGIETNSHRGNFTFRSEFGRDAVTNLRLGTPSRFSVGIGDRYGAFRRWEPYFYGGDEWKLSTSVNLSVGLRYQPVLAPREVAGRTAIPFSCDCGNLSPRGGASWQLPGRWGVLRAAYSLQYNDIYPAALQQLRFNPPGTLKVETQAPSLLNPLSGLTPTDLLPGARSILFVLDSKLATPRSHQYNAAWDLALSAAWRMQIGYVGSRTGRLLFALRGNRARPMTGVDQTTATINLRRSDVRYFETRTVTSISESAFDAARVSLHSPGWRGVTLAASYWFSKAIDLGAPYSSTGIEDDPYQAQSQSEFGVTRDLKSLSDFDQSHALLARIVYSTPRFQAGPKWLRVPLGGWELSGVLLAKTGTPFTVFSGSDGPGFGNVDGASGDRPNLVDTSVLGRMIDNPDTSAVLLPRRAFTFMQPTDERGNLGRNTFRKDGIRNVNASLSKSWRMGPDRSVTLRAESINLLNTPQFAAPGVELTSSDFGRITNTLNDGRAFRFQLRFRF
ncbi:MAG: TonB-dependent receptor, partial [Candidatus Solibacter sp.]|nr:TonB-dependent receptor [Candidatus Solibacter sp.]